MKIVNFRKCLLTKVRQINTQENSEIFNFDNTENRLRDAKELLKILLLCHTVAVQALTLERHYTSALTIRFFSRLVAETWFTNSTSAFSKGLANQIFLVFPRFCLRLHI